MAKLEDILEIHFAARLLQGDTWTTVKPNEDQGGYWVAIGKMNSDIPYFETTLKTLEAVEPTNRLAGWIPDYSCECEECSRGERD